MLLFLIILASLDNILIFKLWLISSSWQAMLQSSEEFFRWVKGRPTTDEKRHNPRIVFWSDQLEQRQYEERSFVQRNRSVTSLTGNGEARHHWRMPEPLCNPDDADCEIPGKWQATKNMTCNPIHEVDLNDFHPVASDQQGTGKKITLERLRVVAKGGKRFVWKMLDFRGSTFAFKMFQNRPNRQDDFGPMTIELQRRDALLHEVTARSPYTINMYGYCGASAIFDFSDGGELSKNIEKDGALTGIELLETSHRVAAAVADVQKSEGFGEPTVAHADIYGSQWVKVRGRYMLTDFNLAKFLKRSKKLNATAPFRREVVDNVSAHAIYSRIRIVFV